MQAKDLKAAGLQRTLSQTDDTLSIAELLDDEGDLDNVSVVEKKLKRYKNLKYIRIGILFCLWLTMTVLLFITKEGTGESIETVVPVNGKNFLLKVQPEADKLTLQMKAPFHEESPGIIYDTYLYESPEQLASETAYKLRIQVVRSFVNSDGQPAKEAVTRTLEYSLISPDLYDNLTTPQLFREHIFTLKPSSNGGVYSLNFSLIGVDKPLPLNLKTLPVATKTSASVAWSAVLIAGMFVLFFWDVVSRGIVAMLFATLTVGLLGLYHQREPLKELLFYINLDTILLVIGLTLIICVFAESGGDHYIAVQCYRLSNGHIWPMLTVMCLAIAFGAAFLDSITILILITSLAIRLCEIMQLNPTSVLTCLILFSNTGYMLTQTGLPEDAVLSQSGIMEKSEIFKNYGSYLLQMLIPVMLSMALTYAYLRFYYESTERMRIIEPTIVSRLRNGIRFWSRTAQAMTGYTKDETALRQNMLFKVDRMRERLRRLGKMPVPVDNFEEHLKQLQDQHQIHDKVLLIMCCVVLLAVVVMQITYLSHAHELSSGWSCILFAFVLLALANWKEFETLMAKIDWSTLITIVCLYIITRALKPLGLVEAIGHSTTSLVNRISESHRMNTGSVMLLIVTTFSSAFMDSEHVCYIMSKHAFDMAESTNFKVQLDPLLLAVLLGTGFGTNATLVSGISNIVCAGMAEKHGFKFYFWDFFKVGIVITFGNIIMGIIYLMIFNAAYGYD